MPECQTLRKFYANDLSFTRIGHRETINRRKPGALHHLAFRSSSRAEVDRLHDELKAIGATIVTAPKEYPEYTPPGYYALYFKDLEGIKYEIVCHELSA